jgi:Ca2+-binding EF-hand superfamily protein
MASKESKSIGPSELEETLISLGLAKTREEVEDALSKFDLNQDGEIDFDEFVEILKISTKDKSNDSYLNNRNILY